MRLTVIEPLMPLLHDTSSCDSLIVIGGSCVIFVESVNVHPFASLNTYVLYIPGVILVFVKFVEPSFHTIEYGDTPP